MGVEIERKFLIRDPSCLQGATGLRISQGYLSHAVEATVRVRLVGERGFLAVKGETTGTRRSEYEYEIPGDDARELLALCSKGRIEKVRHRVPVGRHVWEVDVFEGENAGLVVAEIELADEGESFERPQWLGEEVTGDPRYYNRSLSEKPYRNW